MDVSKLSMNHIELFALANTVAEVDFGIAPIQASPRKQKKIRKWVNTTYIRPKDLPQEVLNYVDKTKSDLEFIEFIDACAEYLKEKNASKKQLMENVMADFSEDVKKAFDQIHFLESARSNDNKIILTLEDCASYKRKLILHTSVENPIDDFHWFDFSDVQLLKEGNGYKLVCTAEKPEEENTVPVTILFDRATTEIDIYRADRRGFDHDPWESLAFMALEILEKESLGAEYFNQKERDSIPLLKELRALLNVIGYYDEAPCNFEILKHYIKKHNLLHLLPFLDKVSRRRSGRSVNSLHLARFVNELNRSACEDLWRELYELVASTQEGYADKFLSYDQEKLAEIKLQIEERFHSLGYEGQYPTFRKKGALKGIRLEESYNLTYWVGGEKNAQYIVQCQELLFDDAIHIQFICGTAFLKKNDAVADIYSCCFNNKGRRLFKTLFWFEKNIDSLDQFVAIAAKRAECIKLTKEEKSLLGQIGPDWNYFITMFIFTGGLFAIMMTAALFLICCLVTAILLGFDEILGMIEYMPWWFIFLFSFVSFGGAMAIVDIKAKNK